MKLYGMGNRTFSWEVLSNLGMRWDSGSAGWTVRALSRARHQSGWWVLSDPAEPWIECVNVDDLPGGLRQARLIPGFMMFSMWLFQNLNFPFLAINPQPLIQILMSSSLPSPVPHFICRYQIASPLVCGDAGRAGQRYHRKESFCPLISATSFIARL